MKNKKLSTLVWFFVSVVIISSLLIFGCNSKKTTTTASSPVIATSPTLASAPSSAPKPAVSETQILAPTSSTTPILTSNATLAPAGKKDLTIGMIGWSGWSIGLNMKHSIEVYFEMLNNKGGLKIGSDTYNLVFKFYDTNNSQTTAIAMANKMVLEDKVKFAVIDPNFAESYIPILEENKVIMDGSISSMATIKPGLDYAFNTNGANFTVPVSLAWYVSNYPDLCKNYLFIAPDNQTGHFSVDSFMGPIMTVLGIKWKVEYYPAGASDLGAAANRILSDNPTTCDCTGGGDLLDSQAVKTVRQAGYKGQFFTGRGMPATTLVQFVPAPGLNGLMSSASPCEFDPPSTQMGVDFKAAWIARYGKWENPSVSLDEITGLIAAIQQAGVLDPDKIMAVVYGGMKWESIAGPGMMVARPDLGNDASRTVDSIKTLLIKKFNQANPEVFATISNTDAIKYYQKVHPEFK